MKAKDHILQYQDAIIPDSGEILAVFSALTVEGI